MPEVNNVNQEEIQFEEVQYLYLTIPSEYVCIYHKLLSQLADFGLDALRDCNSTCKGTNKTIIQCWNMFQAAIAAKELGKDKEAETLIKYIEAQLELVYAGTENNIYLGGRLYHIDENGHVYGDVSCTTNTRFRVTEGGKLYQYFLNENSKKSQCEIDEAHLITPNNNN